MKKLDILSVIGDVYSHIKKGSLDDVVYYGVYKKAVEYTSIHHIGGKFSKLMKTKDGWSGIIRDGKNSFVLYITKNNGGEYNFWETEV